LCAGFPLADGEWPHLLRSPRWASILLDPRELAFIDFEAR
jgi:hypothetical protein